MINMSQVFPGYNEGAYLYTASMCLGNQPAADVLADAVENWQRGTFDFVAAEATAQELRTKIATLIGATPADMAIVTGASGAASTVAAQLPDAIAGQNVVVPSGDFLSNFMAWSMLQDRGYELRTVEDVDGDLSVERFAEVVDNRTAVIAVSLVQSATGFRVDLDSLKSLAAKTGAWLVVDASQGMGSVDIDVQGIAALFSCSHKWLLGVRGMGHLYVRPDLRDSFVPLTPGWKATVHPVQSFYGPDFELSSEASKLDASFGWFEALANLEGMQIIESVGIEEIEAHNLSLVDHLEDSGIEVPFGKENRSPIVSIKLIDPESALKNLHEQGITGSLRAGSLRVSMHLYNNTSDIDALVEAIA